MRAIYKWSSVLALWILAMVPSSAETLHAGMSGDAVTALQNSLVAAGYLARTVDGDYGSTTKEAVYLFQKDKGLSATGEADDATRDAIRRAEGAGYRNGGGVVYAEGNRGDVISDMQQRLQEAGSLKGDIDGVYGGDTVKAVKDFQRSRGFPVSGAIDEVTYRALRDISAGTPAVSSGGESYGVGDRGNDVKTIQRKLKRLGYLDGEADGIYGGQTEDAVTAFQKEQGISVTGGVNSETRTKLNKVYVAQTGDYILSEGARGKRVIHLQNQLLLHGYDPGVVDGVFGAGTADAIRRLQDETGLETTGVADEDVWDALDNAPYFRGKYTKTYHMRSTAYTPYDGGGEGHTALGGFAGKGHAAVDPSVIPLGSIVFIEGYGYAICDDIGGAIHGNIIDVGVDTLAQAYQWGTKSRVKVYLVR
ncbi:MAG: peptidoglycan-binding protein [Dialister sp.]|nr:peptidoglycan-binding protein [Dialister sp.]